MAAKSSLQGKVIALTGAASGIGLATAKLLAQLGAKISIGDVAADSLEKVAEEIRAAGGQVMWRQVDVSNRQSVDSWIEETVSWGERLDGAANIAGTVGRHSGGLLLKDFKDDEWDLIQNVNLKGMMFCLRAELNALSEHGSIVNAASICGLMGEIGSSAYCASKHGVIGLTRTAAKECGTNQRVNCFAPGSIDTIMTRQYAELSGENPVGGAAMKRLGRPEEVAKLIAFLLSDDSSFISGATYSIDGGWFC
ncbi:hypothetical protein FOMG_17187 [Fusarium oxysporum f. sp. melonis 26406]|uniref:3-oxoacyl-[acyl-carrier-protein] reductase FabG n=1 Tax=Fusarium oxysporum f. sp. melonis 26406 TaxID=1089452 RepID=W9ZCA6_FUSOX|nr:hypothetical protein FOMG_17187 [Fusarium oxysporum f. sp. melonis 26406]